MASRPPRTTVATSTTTGTQSTTTSHITPSKLTGAVPVTPEDPAAAVALWRALVDDDLAARIPAYRPTGSDGPAVARVR